LTDRPVAFSVLRVPFFLEPEYDESKVYIESNRERLVKKWGGQAGWEAQKQRHELKGRGQEAGIPHFNLDRLAANSMASHRLIQHVGKTYGLNVSERVYDVLNEYYFVDGHSLNDKPRLAQTVASALDKLVDKPPSQEELLNFLESDSGRKEIIATLNRLYELGVHSIPKFIVEGRYIIDGAAHSSNMIELFREIEARGEVHGGHVFGDLLGVSPKILRQGSHR